MNHAMSDGLTIPQGLTAPDFAVVSAKVREKGSAFGADICVHGSRASGTAETDSDLDIAIRVTAEKFEEILGQRFKHPNSGSALERTMLHARLQGKIQTGELGLSGLRRELEKLLKMRVQISVIRIEGPFDVGPFVPLLES